MIGGLLDLRRQLTDGQRNAAALIEDCLTRIEAANPDLNAFIRIEADSARAAANEADRRYRSGRARPLEGLPIAVKDNLDLTGSPTTAGMLTRKDRVAQSDAGVVRRLKAAGAVIIGKLNMTEAALGADGRNPHYGDCHNPLRHGYSPGGSSSGSAAAVAAGLVPAALGTDTMGSIRIPAAYCGIWGLKPSYGLISTAGSVAVSRRLDHVGPLASCPADLELLLDVLAGFDPACPVARPIQLSEPLETFTLGVPDLSAVDLEPAVEQSWRGTQESLREGGFRLHPLPAWPIRAGRIRRAGLLLCEAEMLAEHGPDWAASRAAFSPMLQTLMEWAEHQSAAQLAEAMRRIDAARLAVNRWLTACDFVMLPTTPQRAFRLDDSTPVNQADLTCLANCAGLPAITLPLPRTAGALPCGVQLVGAHGGDRGVIKAADQIHKALQA